MISIIVKKTPNADTRSANGEMNTTMILKDTEEHKRAVKSGLNTIAQELIFIGEIHDHSKVSNIDEFTKALKEHAEGIKKIKKSDWWQKHRMERHHLDDRVPDDVNLLDVIEMVVDCVVAGMARTGEVYPIELSNDILQKALKNTKELLIKHTKVQD